jgi:8-oxo-dGTP diphosphatase
VSSSLNLRRAVRVVLVDDADRFLLVRWHFDDPDGPVDVWGTPGGGIDRDEEPLEAVRRELLEEVGLDLPVDRCGEPVAHRVHEFTMTSTDGLEWDGQDEDYYLVRVDAFEPRGRLTDEELRAEYLHEMRWFTADEVAALADPPRVVTAPRELAEFLVRLSRDGRPRTPYRLGV